MHNRTLGMLGEDFACKLLSSKGYKVIQRNYKTPLGEIDIISLYKDSIVFTEVKTRVSSRYGKPEEAVNTQRLKRIINTGILYKKIHKITKSKMKIEVVALTVLNGNVDTWKIIDAFA